MTTHTTTSLTAFLLARLDEDEAVAKAATPGPWRYDPTKEWHADPDMLARATRGRMTYGGEEFVGAGPLDATVCVAATGDSDGPESVRDAAHIARHDPARVLAEVKAHRAIVEMAIPSGWTDEGEPVGGGYIEAWWDTLRHLGAIHSAHPDYDESWRP